MSISSSYELPAAQIPAVETVAEVVQVDASELSAVGYIKLAAHLVERFRQDPSILIRDFQDVGPESDTTRKKSDTFRLGKVPAAEAGAWNKITATIFEPSSIRRGIRRAKSLIKDQPELPYTVQIQQVKSVFPDRQLELT